MADPVMKTFVELNRSTCCRGYGHCLEAQELQGGVGEDTGGDRVR